MTERRTAPPGEAISTHGATQTPMPLSLLHI